MGRDGVLPRTPRLLATIAADGKAFDMLVNILIDAKPSPPSALASLMAQDLDAVTATDLLLHALLDMEDGFDLDVLLQWYVSLRKLTSLTNVYHRCPPRPVQNHKLSQLLSPLYRRLPSQISPCRPTPNLNCCCCLSCVVLMSSFRAVVASLVRRPCFQYMLRVLLLNPQDSCTNRP